MAPSGVIAAAFYRPESRRETYVGAVRIYMAGGDRAGDVCDNHREFGWLWGFRMWRRVRRQYGHSDYRYRAGVVLDDAGEPVSWSTGIAAVLIIAGVVMAEWVGKGINKTP